MAIFPWVALCLIPVCQCSFQTPRKLWGFHRTEDRFWPDFAHTKHDYTQEFYQSYLSFISQCPRTGKFCGVCHFLLMQICDGISHSPMAKAIIFGYDIFWVAFNTFMTLAEHILIILTFVTAHVAQSENLCCFSDDWLWLYSLNFSQIGKEIKYRIQALNQLKDLFNLRISSTWIIVLPYHTRCVTVVSCQFWTLQKLLWWPYSQCRLPSVCWKEQVKASVDLNCSRSQGPIFHKDCLSRYRVSHYKDKAEM